MLALLVSEALVLTLMLALRVLAVDHDDVVDAEGTDGGAGKEVAVDVFVAAFLAFARKNFPPDEKGQKSNSFRSNHSSN